MMAETGKSQQDVKDNLVDKNNANTMSILLD